MPLRGLLASSTVGVATYCTPCVRSALATQLRQRALTGTAVTLLIAEDDPSGAAIKQEFSEFAQKTIQRSDYDLLRMDAMGSPFIYVLDDGRVIEAHRVIGGN